MSSTTADSSQDRRVGMTSPTPFPLLVGASAMMCSLIRTGWQHRRSPCSFVLRQRSVRFQETHSPHGDQAVCKVLQTTMFCLPDVHPIHNLPRCIDPHPHTGKELTRKPVPPNIPCKELRSDHERQRQQEDAQECKTVRAPLSLLVEGVGAFNRRLHSERPLPRPCVRFRSCSWARAPRAFS